MAERPSEIPRFDEERVLPDDELKFEAAKKRYFAGLAVDLQPAMRAHKQEGMLERHENPRDEWRNVTEHCLVEAARVLELADMVGLSDEVRRDLMMAAGLHDFYKKSEREIASAHGNSWESFEEASRQSKQKMEEGGFSERVVRLANSVGHGSLLEAEALAAKPELSEDELAFLVLHHVDDYTAGTNWVERGHDPLRERIMGNVGKPAYHALDEAGRQHFGGTTTFKKQYEIGEKVAARLAEVARARSTEMVDGPALPLAVDIRIKQRINAME
jgi:hypothetical protein